MGAVANLLTSANANPVDLVGEWMPEILVRQGKSANFGSVLLGFFAKLKAEAALNGVYNWWERDPVRSNFYSSAANATVTSTLLKFDDGNAGAVAALLSYGSVLKNGRTGEHVLVASDPTTNLTTTEVQVVRDVIGSGVTGIAVLDNDVWSRVTEGSAEGSAPRRADYEQPSNYLNYIQTFKTSAFLSNYYAAGQVRTNMEGPKQDSKVYALEKIVNQIEKAFLIGPKSSGSIGGIQLTGGLTSAVDAAIAADSSLSGIKLNGNGTSGVTLPAFQAWLNAFMVNGSENKFAMCGPLAYSALSTYATSGASGFRIMNGNEGGSKFGLNLTEIQTPFGVLSMAMHPLMKNDVNLQGHMIVADLALVKLKVMEKLHYQEFEPTNGTDAYQGQFRAKLGLMQQYPGAFGYAYDLQEINAA